MLSKIWYLAYVEKPPADFIQNKKSHIEKWNYRKLWNYRKVRVHRNTITLFIEMGGLAIMEVDTQCESVQCSILAKFIKEEN